MRTSVHISIYSLFSSQLIFPSAYLSIPASPHQICLIFRCACICLLIQTHIHSHISHMSADMSILYCDVVRLQKCLMFRSHNHPSLVFPIRFTQLGKLQCIYSLSSGLVLILHSIHCLHTFISQCLHPKLSHIQVSHAHVTVFSPLCPLHCASFPLSVLFTHLLFLTLVLYCAVFHSCLTFISLNFTIPPTKMGSHIFRRLTSIHAVFPFYPFIS